MQEAPFIVPETPQDADSVTQAKEEIRNVKPGFCTFNLNTILLLLLFVGLVVLYILFFSFHSGSKKNAGFAAKATTGKELSIAFVNIDTLNEKYAFVKVLKSDLEGTGKRLQSEVLAEQSALEKEVATFQRQVSSNTISEEKAKMVYEDLMQRQQTLMEKKEKYTQMVADQEYNMNMRLLDTVNNFLKRFNQKAGYDYILSYRTAGDILIANDTLDITGVVLEQINEEYQKSKK